MEDLESLYARLTRAMRTELGLTTTSSFDNPEGGVDLWFRRPDGRRLIVSLTLTLTAAEEE